jgi:transposase-like protein
MKAKRRRHDSAFKARVAIEAMKEGKTIHQIAKENDIHPTQVTDWKKTLAENIAGVFERFFTEFCGWMESAMRKHRDGNTRSNSLRTLRKNAWTYRRLEGFRGGFATGRQALGTAFGLGEERGDLPGMWREHEPA